MAKRPGGAVYAGTVVEEGESVLEVKRRLPRLFGGEEVLRAAASLCHDEDTKEALACLARLYRRCAGWGWAIR